jgi:hypothetical protein
MGGGGMGGMDMASMMGGMGMGGGMGGDDMPGLEGGDSDDDDVPELEEDAADSK